jgi:hypothetical protein
VRPAPGTWGQENKNGTELLLEQMGNKIAGYPVKLIVYDTGTNSTKTA